jgi:hypothetical protein
MAFRIQTQILETGQYGTFKFDGPVRQYAIGLGGWTVNPVHEREPRPAHPRAALVITHGQDATQRDEIHFQISADIYVPPSGGTWARCHVACIADVATDAGDLTPDACADLDAQGSGRLGCQVGQRISERVLTGFELEKQGGAWSGMKHEGFIGMANTDGRTFSEVVEVGRGGFMVDFQEKIGRGVKIQSAAAFLQDPRIDRVLSFPVAPGGVMGIGHEGSRVFSTAACGYGQLLIVVRTESVVVKHRTAVHVRLSEIIDVPDSYCWEWEVSPDHWHRISRASDDLDWFAAEGFHTIEVKVGNNTDRPIQLTLDGDEWASVAAKPGTGDMEWSPPITFGDGPAREIRGKFTNGEKEPLPDPTFVPIKQGGG